MKYCAKCGKELKEGAKFCAYCGYRTGEVPHKVFQNNNPNPEKMRIIADKDPVFRVVCEYCRCEFEYGLSNLGYRVWYPSGFVYCPKCQKPLRHRIEYEVK